MKLITYTLIALLLTTTLVVAAKIETTIRLADEANATLYMKQLDKTNVNIVRFKDGTATCYVSVLRFNGKEVNNASISCVN